MVSRSSSPWVGWAWRPSPALITCRWLATWLAIRCGAPLCACRTTNMSACIAERLSTVSSRVSPLVWEDTAMLRLITSADRRLAAISKVVRVRVEASKNKLNTDLPRNRGTFLTSRAVTPTKEVAVSRIWVSISRGRPSMVSRCCSSPLSFSCGLRIQFQPEFAVLVPVQHQHAPWRHLQPGANILRGDRQFAPAAVDQHGEADRSRPAVIEQFVHRPAHRSTGVEHVVDQDDVAAVDLEWDLRRLYLWMQPGLVEIVAVEGDIDKTWLH